MIIDCFLKYRSSTFYNISGKHDVTDDHGFHGHVPHQDGPRPYIQINHPNKSYLLPLRYYKSYQLGLDDGLH